MSNGEIVDEMSCKKQAKSEMRASLDAWTTLCINTSAIDSALDHEQLFFLYHCLSHCTIANRPRRSLVSLLYHSLKRVVSHSVLLSCSDAGSCVPRACGLESL